MKKINLGCGKRNFGPDWIHVDDGDYEHLDYKCSVKKIPFDDNEIDLIYASHVLEYFDREEVKVVLKEWNRILKPGGTLRLAVPDFAVMAWLYCSKTYPGISNYTLDSFLGPLYGKMDMGTKIIYHKTIYDEFSLSIVLRENGFESVRKWDWQEVEHGKFDDHSQAYLPHMDKENGTLISLNLECIKL